MNWTQLIDDGESRFEIENAGLHFVWVYERGEKPAYAHEAEDVETFDEFCYFLFQLLSGKPQIPSRAGFLPQWIVSASQISHLSSDGLSHQSSLSSSKNTDILKLRQIGLSWESADVAHPTLRDRRPVQVSFIKSEFT